MLTLERVKQIYHALGTFRVTDYEAARQLAENEQVIEIINASEALDKAEQRLEQLLQNILKD